MFRFKLSLYVVMYYKVTSLYRKVSKFNNIRENSRKTVSYMTQTGYNTLIRIFKSTMLSFRQEFYAPYLDHNFCSYFLSLPPEMRQPQNGIEKYLIRSAFDATGILPSEIIWRPKVMFSDALANTTSLEKITEDFVNEQVCN